MVTSEFHRKVRRRFLLLLLISISLLLGNAVLSADNSGEVIQSHLGEYVFFIPEKNSLEKGVPVWLRWLPGLDNASREVLIVFPAHDVSAAVDGYKTIDGEYKEDIRVLLVVMNEVEIRRYEDPRQYEDLWKAFGSYQDRLVEEYKNGLYKVYRESEYPYSWALLSRNPEEVDQVPDEISDFWVAHCIAGRSSVTKSGSHATCKTRVIRNDLLIEFNISEQNIELVQRIGDFLFTEISSWR